MRRILILAVVGCALGTGARALSLEPPDGRDGARTETKPLSQEALDAIVTNQILRLMHGEDALALIRSLRKRGLATDEEMAAAFHRAVCAYKGRADREGRVARDRAMDWLGVTATDKQLYWLRALALDEQSERALGSYMGRTAGRPESLALAREIMALPPTEAIGIKARAWHQLKEELRGGQADDARKAAICSLAEHCLAENQFIWDADDALCQCQPDYRYSERRRRLAADVLGNGDVAVSSYMRDHFREVKRQIDEHAARPSETGRE